MFSIIVLLLSCSRLLKANFACGGILVPTETTYNCNSPEFDLGSLSQIPTGGKVIYLQTEIKVSSSGCSASTPYHLATLTINPSAGSVITLIDVNWNGSDNFMFLTTDSIGSKIAYRNLASRAVPFDQWFSFSVWINLDTNTASARFIYTDSGSATIIDGTSFSYDPTWTIDMTPMLYPCSNANGVDSIKCSLKNFKVWYQEPANPNEIVGGITPILIAQYRLNQHNGVEVIDSAPSPLGSAYFGSSTGSRRDPSSANKPSWVPEEEPTNNNLMQYSGIVFDLRTQFVTIPNFPIAKSLLAPTYSLTLKIWIKLSSVSGFEGYLFRYSDSGLVADIFAIQIEPTRQVTILSYDTSTTSTLMLSPTGWNSVVATFTSMDYTVEPPVGSLPTSIDPSLKYQIYITMMLNNSPEPSASLLPTTRYAYQISDRVRLGGPPTVKGIVAGVEIYSPGTNFMTKATSCQPSTCLRDLGITLPSTCILSICPANCVACFGSQVGSCLACNSGYSLYQGQCFTSPSCKPGNYLDTGNVCQGCIMNCESCSDGTSCDICKTGFVKQGSVCACPSGFTLDSTTNTCIGPNPCDNPSNFYYPSEGSCKSTCKYPFKIVYGTPLQNCVLDINEQDAAQAESVAQLSSITNSATNFGGAVLGLLSSTNFGLVMMQSLAEMLSYIQYLKIDYPPKVYLMLEQQDINSGGLSIITAIPEQVEQAIPNHPLPEEFAKNDTRSSFVANSWDFLISLASILLSIGLVLIFSPCFKRFPMIYSFMSKILHALKWNMFFGMFCSGYGFTAIFTALEFRTVNMDSSLSILSFIVSLLINTLGFFAMYIIIQICLTFSTIRKSVKNQEEKAKRLEEAEENWKSYEALFGDYKNKHMSQHMFLLIFMFRTYIHYSILGYLNEYPFLQTCTFVIISMAMILYLIIIRPMKSKVNYAQQLVCEIAILIVNASVLFLASMDKWMVDDNETRVKVGDVIIAMNFGLSLVGSVFMIYETISQIKMAYLFIKKWLQSRSRKGLSKFTKKDSNKSYKVRISRPKIRLDIHAETLDISDLDKSNDASIDQLKPR